MGIQAEAEVRLAGPIFQIVSRSMARASKIRNLILRDARRIELLCSFGIHVGDGLLIRHHAHSVARTSCDHLSTQPRIFIHVEHVYAQVRHSCRDDLRERFSPALAGLMWKSCDQVDIDVVDAGGAKPINVMERDGSRVGASNGSGFVIHKRLHAEADAIESQAWHGEQHLVTYLAGRTFQNYLCGIFNGKYFPYCFKYFS